MDFDGHPSNTASFSTLFAILNQALADDVIIWNLESGSWSVAQQPNSSFQPILIYGLGTVGGRYFYNDSLFFVDGSISSGSPIKPTLAIIKVIPIPASNHRKNKNKNY
ncbi:hypothetical protein O181_029987 [Austropuccinia psidii MF-1]|uniref:Uncharacterized protein n=1 Tax=Austropuccinia psidii MF-1 TaxID=1389203 RepID=A0A9Q3H405_9BASI|nr:hypothetical protein [Austropuccinia psidii MF-1]